MPPVTKFQFNPFYKPRKNHVTKITLNLTRLKAPQLASPHLNHSKQHWQQYVSTVKGDKMWQAELLNSAECSSLISSSLFFSVLLLGGLENRGKKVVPAIIKWEVCPAVSTSRPLEEMSENLLHECPLPRSLSFSLRGKSDKQKAATYWDQEFSNHLKATKIKEQCTKRSRKWHTDNLRNRKKNLQTIIWTRQQFNNDK